MNKKIFIFFLTLLIIGLTIRLYFAFFHFFDGDEFVHLHSSWLVAQKLLPYRDFHQFHLSLFWYLLAPLFIIFKTAPALLYAARLLMFFLNLAIFYYTYKIANFYGGKKSAILSLLLLSFMVIYLRKSIEVRPDLALTLMGLAGIYSLINQRKSNPPIPPLIKGGFFTQNKNFILSGLCLGAGVLFVQKGIFYIFGLSLGLFFSREIKKSRLIYFLVASAIPLGLLTLIYLFQKALPIFISSAFLLPLKMTKCFPAWDTLRLTFFHYDTFFWLVTILGAIRFRKIFLPLSVIISFFVYLLFFATSYYQYYLPFIPLLSIYGGLFLKKFEGKKLVLFFFLGLIQPGLFILKEISDPQTQNKDQIKLISYVLKHTPPDEAIFDGWAEYIFRPHAYPVFQIGRGLLNTNIYDDIPKYLKEKECKILLGNGHLNDLKPGIVQFLAENYIYSGYDILYLTGKQLLVPASQKIEFELIASGNYRPEFEGKPIFIDGKSAKANKKIFLSKGRHNIYSPEAKKIVLIYDL